MIKFAIPGLYEHKELNQNLITLINSNPQFFRENIKIGAVYGNFQFSTWDGGRTFLKYKQASKEEIEDLQNIYNNKFNIPMRFVFTNTEIEERDCYDRFNNLVLEICHNSINEVVINSPILENYIRKTYPKYKIISSTTKCLKEKEIIFNEINNYHLVCLDYNLNKNWNFLNSIPKNQRNKIEILVNAICPAGCPYRKEHYKLNSLYHLSYGKKIHLPNCLINSNTLAPELEKKNNLSINDIYEKYSKESFIYFKLEGRTLSTFELILNYAKYLAKPEYVLFISQILSSFENKIKFNQYL